MLPADLRSVLIRLFAGGWGAPRVAPQDQACPRSQTLFEGGPLDFVDLYQIPILSCLYVLYYGVLDLCIPYLLPSIPSETDLQMPQRLA